MEREKATVIAIIAAVLIITSLTVASPRSILALGHWNEDFDQDGESAIGSVASPDTHFILPNLFPKVEDQAYQVQIWKDITALQPLKSPRG